MVNHNKRLLIVTDLCPNIVSLQETFLKQKDKNYQISNHIQESGLKTSEGTWIIIRNSIPLNQI